MRDLALTSSCLPLCIVAKSKLKTYYLNESYPGPPIWKAKSLTMSHAHHYCCLYIYYAEKMINDDDGNDDGSQ